MLDENDVLSLVARIECEYREMPGLRLTERQMRRMWCIDEDTCQMLVTVLVARGVVVRTHRNAYARANRGDNPAAA